MEKLFVQYPNFRSSTEKYDPCVIHKNTLKCPDCRVQIISDRFLGEEFMRKVMRGRFNYPYILIADTAGCNMRCWFCYSWQFWTKSLAEEKGCKPSFASPEKLADQFSCKFKLMSDMDSMLERVDEKHFLSDKDKKQASGHISRRFPVRGIRISGGEPIFATSRVLQPYESEKPVDYLVGAKYWLTFFENFDMVVGRLKDKNTVHLVDSSNWNWTHPFPSILTNVDGRMKIRFDTNGIAFGDHKFSTERSGSKEIADSFVNGIHDLFQNGKLENTQIMIDYSLKGATPTEFMWSQRQWLPVTMDRNKADFKLEEHPQYSGFKNLTDKIEGFVKKNPRFAECLYISVEKGIEHGRNNKFFVNHPEALDWNRLEKRLHIKLSDVSNEIDLANPWRYQAQIYRYMKKHASARMIASSGKISVDSGKEGPEELIQFVKNHRKEKDFKFVVYPSKESRASEKEQPSLNEFI